MPTPTLDLLINIRDPDKNGLLDSFFSAGSAAALSFLTRTDLEQLRIRLVEPDPAAPGRWRYLDPTGGLISVALGDPDSVSQSGSVAFNYNGGASAAALDFDETAAHLQTTLSALSTTAGAGAVTVQKLATGFYQITFNSFGAKALFGGDPVNLQPQSVVKIARAVPGDGDTYEIQTIEYLQVPLCYAEPATALPAAAGSVNVDNPGASDAKSVQTITLNPPPEGGSFKAIGVAGHDYTFSALATEAELQAALPTGFLVSKPAANQWRITFPATGGQSTIALDVSQVLVPLGLSGAMELSTIALAQRFFTSGSSKTLSFTFEVKVQLAGWARPYTVLQVPVTIGRAVIDFNNLVPAPLPSYLTASQSDLRYALKEIVANQAALQAIPNPSDRQFAAFANDDYVFVRYQFQLGAADPTDGANYPALTVRDNTNTGCWYFYSGFDTYGNDYDTRATVLPGALQLLQGSIALSAPGAAINGTGLTVNLFGGKMGGSAPSSAASLPLCAFGSARYRGLTANLTQSLPPITNSAPNGSNVIPGFTTHLFNDDATGKTVTLSINGASVILQPGDRLDLRAIAPGTPDLWEYSVTTLASRALLASAAVPTLTGAQTFTGVTNIQPAGTGGGTVTIAAQAGGASGGSLYLQGGSGTSVGGDVSITGGSGGPFGAIYFGALNTSAINIGYGGNVTNIKSPLNATPATVAGAGASTTLAGQSSSGGQAGALILLGGSGTTTAAGGGDVTITAGSAPAGGFGNAGNLNLNAGSVPGWITGAINIGNAAINAQVRIGSGASYITLGGNGVGTAFKNIRHGTSGAMSLGVITVSDPGATATTRYYLTCRALSGVGTIQTVRVSSRSAGSSFTISSASGSDASTWDWLAIEP